MIKCLELWNVSTLNMSHLLSLMASKMFAIQNLTWSLEFVILKKSQRWHHFSFKLSLKLKISTKKYIANYS